MTRVQAFLIALSVAFAVVAGTYAAMQTTKLGTGATTHISPTALAHERRALQRSAVALHHALKQHPPKLPPVRRPAPPPARVVYVPGPSPVVTLPAQPANLPPRRVTPKPVTKVVVVTHHTHAVAPTRRRPTTAHPAPAPVPVPAAAPAPVAPVVPVVGPPTATTTPPTTTQPSPPPSGGGDDGSDDSGHSDGNDDGSGADD